MRTFQAREMDKLQHSYLTVKQGTILKHEPAKKLHRFCFLETVCESSKSEHIYETVTARNTAASMSWRIYKKGGINLKVLSINKLKLKPQNWKI
jgi:hypothetical protein